MRWTITLDPSVGDVEVVDVDVSRETDDPLPAAVRDPVGLSIGGGKITIATADGYSPWLDAALTGATFTLDLDGVQVMTGTVRTVEGSARSRQVALQVVDPSGPMVDGNYDVPVFIGDYGSSTDRRPGLQAQWVADHILAQYGLSPHQALVDDNALFAMSLMGSAWPVPYSASRIVRWSANAGFGAGPPPDYAAATWGLAADSINASVEVPAVTLVKGDRYRMIVALEPVDGVPPDVEMYCYTDVTGVTQPEIGVLVDGSVASPPILRVYSADVTPSADETFEPTDPGYLVVDVDLGDSAGQLTITTTAYYRGVEIATNTDFFGTTETEWNFSTAPLTLDSGGAGYAGAWFVQVNPTGSVPVAPAGTLRNFADVALVVSAPDTAPDGAWDAIKQIAFATGGTFWVDADGNPQAVGPEDYATTEPAGTIDADTLEALDWAADVDATIARIRVPFVSLPAVQGTPSVYGDIIYQEIMRTTVPAGRRVVRTVTMPGAARIAEGEFWAKVFASPDDDPTDDSLVIGRTRIVRTQEGPNRAKVVVRNTSGTDGYVLITVRLDPDEPSYYESEGEDVIEVTTGAPGTKEYTFPASAWSQDPDVAAAIAANLRTDLRDPPPETVWFPIADPSSTVDVGDVLALDEAYFTGAYSRRVIVTACRFLADGRRVVSLRGLRDTYTWFAAAADGGILDTELTTYTAFAADYGAAGTTPTTYDDWAANGPAATLGV